MEKEKHLKIPEIIVKDLNKETNIKEDKMLQEWLSQSDDNLLLYNKIKQKESLVSIAKEYNNIDIQLAWKKINKTNRNKWINLSVLKYAAVIMIPVMIGAFFIFQQNQSADLDISLFDLEQQIINLDESTLIMADGKIISLVAESMDSIIEIDGTQITKDKSEILYSRNEANVDKEIKYNTLITPKSKVFSLILADGSKVWLNAKSAIKYPIQFNTKERKVYLTGEAFFEVKKDIDKPFIVSTTAMEIEVLGTTFNVMAYSDDNIAETTLIEGEVKIRTLKCQCILEPGKQAKFDKKLEHLVKIQVNTELYTSWRDGKYIFEYKDLEFVMTKLSRWYDVDISYLNDKVKNVHFTGTLYKYNDIKQTLHIIELATSVRFELIENSVTVY